MITKKQREALLVEIHKEIERSASSISEALAGNGELPEFCYPPNHGLSPTEAAALKEIPKNPALVAALRKVIADGIATPFFQFFCLLDGVADPEEYGELWPTLEISPHQEGQPEDHFFNDDFYEPYWLWRTRLS